MARRTDCLFQADNSGGHRQSNWLWWYALGCTFAEEHFKRILYEPGGVVGPQDHARLEIVVEVKLRDELTSTGRTSLYKDMHEQAEVTETRLRSFRPEPYSSDRLT